MTALQGPINSFLPLRRAYQRVVSDVRIERQQADELLQHGLGSAKRAFDPCLIERIARAHDLDLAVAIAFQHFLVRRADIIHHLANVVVRRPAVIAAERILAPVLKIDRRRRRYVFEGNADERG